MALTDERIGQIAIQALQHKLEQDGIKLNPKEVKREIYNASKRMGILSHELAEFMKIMIRAAYNKTIAELDSIEPTDKVEEE